MGARALVGGLDPLVGGSSSSCSPPPPLATGLARDENKQTLKPEHKILK